MKDVELVACRNRRVTTIVDEVISLENSQKPKLFIIYNEQS